MNLLFYSIYKDTIKYKKQKRFKWLNKTVCASGLLGLGIGILISA